MKIRVLHVFVSVVILNINLFAVRIYSASDLGGRLYQEDVVVVDTTKQEYSYCAVFDGHGGVEIAQSLKDVLLSKIIGCMKPNENIDDVIKNGFLAASKDILDTQRKTKYHNDIGSTALITFIFNGNMLVVANAGDSRAVLCKTNSEAIQITNDHKASDPSEYQRIKNHNGVFIYNNRVFGILAVSRAFGDLNYGECISPEPDVFIESINTDFRFLILASDGLWDVMKNDLAVSTVIACGGPSEKACHQLIKVAMELRSKDNISVIIIDFKN